MPVDLHKKSDSPANWELWLQSHAPIFIVICIIILVLLIIGLIFALVDVSAVPITSTEANGYYYHLERLA